MATLRPIYKNVSTVSCRDKMVLLQGKLSLFYPFIQAQPRMHYGTTVILKGNLEPYYQFPQNNHQEIFGVVE